MPFKVESTSLRWFPVNWASHSWRREDLLQEFMRLHLVLAWLTQHTGVECMMHLHCIAKVTTSRPHPLFIIAYSLNWWTTLYLKSRWKSKCMKETPHESYNFQTKFLNTQNTQQQYELCAGLQWWYLIRSAEPWLLHQLCCWSVLGWVISRDLGMPQLCPQCSNYPCCLLTAAPLWGCWGLARCWPLLPVCRRRGGRGGRGGLGGEAEDKRSNEEGRRVSWQLDIQLYIHTHTHTFSSFHIQLHSHTLPLRVSKGRVLISLITTFIYFQVLYICYN